MSMDNFVSHLSSPQPRRPHRFNFSNVDPLDAPLRSHRLSRLLPLISNPSSGEGQNSETLKRIKELEGYVPEEALKEAEEIQKQSEEYRLVWVDGFIDLFFTTGIASYNGSHDLVSGLDVENYSGFFAIIWFTWVSMVTYDLRFAKTDVYNRILKFVELAIFVSYASYASGFNLLYGLSSSAKLTMAPNNSGGSSSNELPSFMQRESLQLVALTYIVSKALAIIQYIVVIFWELMRRKKEKGAMEMEKFGHTRMDWNSQEARRFGAGTLLPLLGSFIGMAMWIGGYLMVDNEPGKTRVRLLLWYLALLIEVLLSMLSQKFKGFSSFQETNIRERFGILTLVFLGEGVVQLGAVITSVATGMGFSDIIFGQVFCSILLVYCVFHLYFENFQKRLRSSGLSQVFMWFHFPFHLMVAFMFEGVKGVLRFMDAGYTFVPFSDRVTQVLDTVINGTYSVNSSLTERVIQDSSLLGIDFPAFISQFQNDTTTAQFNVTLNRFYTEAVNGIYQQFNIQPNPTTQALFQQIQKNDSAATPENFALFVQEISTTGAAPVLYVSVVSGGLMLMLGILLAAGEWPRDRYSWLPFISRTCLGLLLIASSFLDIGSHTYGANGEARAYKWLDSQSVLPAIAGVFIVEVAIEYIILLLARRAYARTSPGPQFGGKSLAFQAPSSAVGSGSDMARSGSKGNGDDVITEEILEKGLKK